MRNFRSLDTAAKRVETLLDTMRQVSKNYSLGVDPALLKDLNDDDCYSHELGELANTLRVFVEENQSKSKIDHRLKSIRKRKLKCEPSHISRYYPLPEEQCRNANWFRAGRLVSHDCRPLRERHIKLYEALKSFDSLDGLDHGTKLIDFLDHFGIEVSMPISEAFDGPTRHLSMFFDSYFIANSDGEVHFTRNNNASWSDQDEYKRTSIPFASFAEIAHLLFEKPDEAISAESIFSEDESSEKAGAIRVGHSTVRVVKVDGVALSVFIHPLTIDVSSTAAPRKSTATEAEKRSATGPVKASYIVGVVRQRTLAKEAIRLRLGPAVDATLTIAMLLALLPILRFWATGDRSISGRVNLYGIGASAVAATALGTALLWGFITKHVDGQILDERLVDVSKDVRRNFRGHLNHAIEALEADVNVMLTGSPKTEEAQCRSKRRDECGDPHVMERLRKHLLCPVPANADPAPSIESARLLTTFLIDDRGEMKVCRRYRERSSQQLNLSFRNYFKTPNMNEPTAGTLQGRERGVPFLDQIDSIVQGTKEIVVSFAVRKKNGSNDGETAQKHVAVAITRLQSIDDVVLPPHFEYAIVDQSGATIFHSDNARVRVSNFIDDTGNSPAIRTAMKLDNTDVLDATYDGIPIRAHISPLHRSYDTAWALVVFRNHGFVDSISSLATSLAIFWWLAVTLAVILIAILSAYVRRLFGFSKTHPSTVLTLVYYKVAIVVFVLSVFGLLHVLGDIDDVTTTMQLPFLIVGLILFFAWSGVGVNRREKEGFKHSEIGTTFALAVLVFSVAVVPMLGWQSYFRAQLSRGLVEHLKREAIDAIDEKRTDFRSYIDQLQEELGRDDNVCRFLGDSVAGYEVAKWRSLVNDALRTGDRRQRGLSENAPRCERSATRSEWFIDFLSPLVSYSSFSQAIMWYRSGGDETCDVKSPTDALEVMVGRIGARHPELTPNANGDEACDVKSPADAPDGPTQDASGDSGGDANSPADAPDEATQDASGDTKSPADAPDEPTQNASGDVNVQVGSPLVWLAITAYVLAFLFICYSVVRTKFGHARRIALLPPWYPSEFTEDEIPVRMLLVKQSDVALKDLISDLKENWHVEVTSWDNVTSTWRRDNGVERGSARPKRRTIYVVEDLRGATEGNRVEKLASELKAILRNESIILCSDIVPTYHMRPGTLEEPNNILLPDAKDWLNTLHEFEVRVLCGINADSESKKMSTNLRADVMETEAKANRDLERMAHKVARRLNNENGKDWYSDPQLRDEALRQFRAMAQPKFKTQWEASSFDERLQLIALARGGNTNIRQPAAISSLANRGLITTTDPLQLRSEAFRQFIKDDLAHDKLDGWRRRGHHDWWRVTWLPLVVLAVLGLLFFLSSNPQAVGTLAAVGAASIGLIPVIMSLLRIGQTVQSTGTDAPTNPT